MARKKTVVYIIQAYEKEEIDGRLIDIATLELVDDVNPEAALKRAKTILKDKKKFRIHRIIEKYDSI
jgi:hypothetical protein